MSSLEADQSVGGLLIELVAFGDPADKVAQWWDLTALGQLYAEFVDTHAPTLESWRSLGGTPSGQQAFADYVRALTAWRRLPYLDPGLPTDLLPASWSGTTAAETFFALHALLADPAHDFVTAEAGAVRPG